MQRSHLCKQLTARNEHETFGSRSLEFIISTLALVTAVVRKMPKTLVTLGNMSRVLLNVTKRLIFARLLLPLNVHAVNDHIFCLVH